MAVFLAGRYIGAVALTFLYIRNYIVSQPRRSRASLLFISRLLCFSARRITHERVYGCRPNIDKGWSSRSDKISVLIRIRMWIHFSATISIMQMRIIRYILIR